MNSELINLMSALGDELGLGDLVANSQGRYSLTFDDVSVEFYQSHGWVIVESDLQLELNTRLNYQQESALEKVMQQALIDVRNHNASIAINEQNKLTLAQKAIKTISGASFISMVNDQVDIAEKYQKLVRQHTLVGSSLNNVWLP